MEQQDKESSTPAPIIYKYKSGIPTLRSSAHRVRASINKIQKNEPQPKRTTLSSKKSNGTTITKNNDDTAVDACTGTMLPASIREVERIPYDINEYNFNKAIIDFLNSLNSSIIGGFEEKNKSRDEDNLNDLAQQPLLENFQVPIQALEKRSNKRNKRGLLLAQEQLSQAMSDCFFENKDGKFEPTLSSPSSLIVQTFDNFVTCKIIPHLKKRLIREGIVSESQKINFYYQRPPTLRIQPGPSRAKVNTHKDRDYGHQNGELNFWVPLTDRLETGVDLYVESEEDGKDFKPLETDIGFVSSFFGTGCSHYVNENLSESTRVSLDFRVGIEPFYDPVWSKIGTKDDHLRKRVEM